ncbi:MAG TPA: DUF1788 domain-containing protein [Candidatus Ozemobacteraceae bacterium]|nr:DUF1788 domain-containing protein [Candidatus Ozemobacteraceae bacterium]
MKTELEKRLNQILPRLTSPELLTNTGLGNEIGFYIFDYPAENELDVREHITHLLKQLEKKHSDIKVKHVNLFELVIDYLKSRNLLDKALKIEREKGDAELLKALQSPLHVEKLADWFGQSVQPQSCDLVLISGVGSAYPLIRSHGLLNNLPRIMGRVPLVVFYPGKYDMQSLRLFGRLSDNNYYRAFRLVP